MVNWWELTFRLDRRVRVLAAWLLISGLAAGQAGRTAGAPDSGGQAAYVPTMTFDVASVRQSPEADSYMVSGSFLPHSTSLRITNFDARNLLGMAYGVRWDQIVGLPDWHAMFNIEAKSDSDADEQMAKLTKAQQWLEQKHMLQRLLADRFKLKVHWETREGPTYNLVVAKGGPKMEDAKDGPRTPEEIKIWGDRRLPPLYQQGDGRAGYVFIAHGATLNDITETLASQFGEPVVDRTGVAGRYDFTLRYDGARLSDRSADDLNPVPTLDVAIQNVLGLKLEPAKGPIQFLVVDHIEKPSEN